MLNLNNFSHIHFIGCGGAGMFPLAAIMQQRGFKVSGSDLSINEKTTKLEKLGVNFFLGHSKDNLPLTNTETDKILVVYSSAVDDTNLEFLAAKETNLIMLRRGVFLGLLANSYKKVITVSGSHGKTSITAMTVFLFNYFNIKASWIIGGEIVEEIEAFNEAIDNNIFITEVDESDGTHTDIHSFIGLIPNIEDDHSWSVGGDEQLMANFKQYANQADKIFSIKGKHPKNFWDNFSGDLTLLPAITSESQAKQYFIPKDLITNWGFYQMENALLAVNALSEFGIDKKDALKALNNFPGIKRRAICHYKAKNDKLQLIEDYAHHPTEVNSIISTMLRRFPNKQLWVIFQPHRYARLEKYLTQFAKELSNANKIFITPVFAAWVNKNHIDSNSLARLITTKVDLISHNWKTEAKKILTEARQNDSAKILLVLGAGDINQLLNEMKNILFENEKFKKI